LPLSEHACSTEQFLRLPLLVGHLANCRVTILFFSSLAAYSLPKLGLLNTTDMIGGYKAWKAAELPIDLDNQLERI
jgi:hypothetical protein